MSEHSSGWRRIGSDLLRVLCTLVSIEDAPEQARRSSDRRINPATGLGMVGSMDAGGNPYGLSAPRLPKR